MGRPKGRTDKNPRKSRYEASKAKVTGIKAKTRKEYMREYRKLKRKELETLKGKITTQRPSDISKKAVESLTTKIVKSKYGTVNLNKSETTILKKLLDKLE